MPFHIPPALKHRRFTCLWVGLLISIAGSQMQISAIFWHIRNTIRQLQTPDNVRSRMTGINQVFFMGGPQLGEVEAGAVAQLFGVPFAIISAGIGCILGMFLIALKWPQLRFYDSQTTGSVLSTAK